MRKLRIGLIGTGVSGQLHVDAVRELDDCDIVAVADRTQELADAAAERFGIPHAYGDYRAMLDDVDIVHNSTPNHLHAEVNDVVLRHGKHLLAEKPLALTSAASAPLVDLARTAHAQGVVTGVCFIFRFKDTITAIKEQLDSGAYGPVHFVRGGYLQDWLLLDSDWSWRVQPQFSGPLNSMADLGSHLVDLVQFVTGRKAERVCARLGTLHRTRRSGADVHDVTLDDHGAVLLELEGGVLASLTTSQTTAGRCNRIHLEIDAATSSFVWDGDEPTWHATRLARGDGDLAPLPKDPVDITPAPPAEDDLIALIKEFNAQVRAAERGAHAPSRIATIDESHQVMEVLDAIAASHASGRWETVGAGA